MSAQCLEELRTLECASVSEDRSLRQTVEVENGVHTHTLGFARALDLTHKKDTHTL